MLAPAPATSATAAITAKVYAPITDVESAAGEADARGAAIEVAELTQASDSPTPPGRTSVALVSSGRFAGNRRGMAYTVTRELHAPPTVRSSSRARRPRLSQLRSVARRHTDRLRRGPAAARMMLVGEQPGDQEDRGRHPFVGPAGRLLDEALPRPASTATASTSRTRSSTSSGSARGKRRYTTSPIWSEVAACRPWLDGELEACHDRTCSVLLGRDRSAGAARAHVPRHPEPRRADRGHRIRAVRASRPCIRRRSSASATTRRATRRWVFRRRPPRGCRAAVAAHRKLQFCYRAVTDT